MKIKRAVLKVIDIEKMKNYYTSVLGMEVISIENKKVNLGINNNVILTLVTDEGVILKSREEANLYHIAYLLPNREELANFLGHIIDSKTEVQGAADHLVSEAIYMTDPEGNGIEVYADRDRDKWKYLPNGNVIMDTIPLNADELYNLSNGEKYKLSSEAVIGHIHMQSYDVDKMTKFYKNNFLLSKTSELPDAIFLSYDGYHHHFAFNHWDYTVSEPGSENSTGLKLIEYEIDSERFFKIKENLSNTNKIEESGNFIVINDPNNIKIKIYEE
ncbi:MAG: VOC family protein [Sebaldella sp.]|nr:VOC family protein [Sebaldella sp.]